MDYRLDQTCKQAQSWAPQIMDGQDDDAIRWARHKKKNKLHQQEEIVDRDHYKYD